MNYYYLMASVPDFNLDDPPPLLPEEFRALCGEHLTRSDLQAVDELISPSGAESGNDFIQDWREFDTQLRNSIVKARATRLGRDAADHLREQKGFDGLVDRAVSDAFLKDNPLAREKVLDLFRWGRLGELAGFNPFAGRAVLAYTLKLLLAQRWAQMNAEEGTRRADDTITRDPTNDGGDDAGESKLEMK